MPAMTRTRWWILTLLFFITTINYLDRIVLSVLIPVIRKDLHITTEQYGYVTGAFQLAYTIGFLFMGRLIDRYGTRLGYGVAIAFWSAAAMLHALVRTTVSLGFWRAMLGLGESGNFPAAIKAVTEWFPKKDRALAIGLLNAGTNVASMVGPALFVWMNSHYGWRACFAITGGLGFFWLFLWLLLYRLPEMHPRVNRAELDYIHSDGPETSTQTTMSWSAVLRYKQTFAFALAKFLTDPVWWFYLFWLPPYLYDVRKFNLTEIAWALPVIYLMADFGSVVGRLDVGALYPHRLDTRSRPQGQHGLRRDRDADSRHGRGGAERRAGGAADQFGHGGTPGVVRESLHDHDRRLPQACRRLGHRHRRLRRRPGRCDHLGISARFRHRAFRLQTGLPADGRSAPDIVVLRVPHDGRDAPHRRVSKKGTDAFSAIEHLR